MLGSLAVPGAHAPGPPMQAISEKFCRPSGLSLDGYLQVLPGPQNYPSNLSGV